MGNCLAHLFKPRAQRELDFEGGQKAGAVALEAALGHLYIIDAHYLGARVAHEPLDAAERSHGEGNMPGAELAAKRQTLVIQIVLEKVLLHRLTLMQFLSIF